MRILILGGSGLVGRQVVALLEPHHEVIAPSRHELDLATDWDPAVLPSRIEAIVHVAQARRWREFPQEAAQTIAINLTSTAKLLGYAAAHGIRSFVYASTGGVYQPSTHLLDESSPLIRPDAGNLYLATKLASELLIGSYRSLIDASILRLFTVHGDGADPQSLIPRLEHGIAAGSAVTLVKPDGVLLRPTAAAEVAQVVDACLAHPASRILNVGGTEILSLRALAARIGASLGVEPVFELMDGEALTLAPSKSWTEVIDEITRQA